MSVIGFLRVLLSADTASFDGPLKASGDAAKRTARDMQDSFDRINTHEALGGVKLLGEEIGVHLPRHVSSLIATLPGVAAAMEFAFPALAVLAVIKAVSELNERMEKHKEQLEQSARSAIDEARAMDARSASLSIANLKLEDSIRILQKEVPQNGPKIAAEEATQALEKLAQEFDKVIEREQKLFKEEEISGFIDTLKESFNDKSIGNRIDQTASSVRVQLAEMLQYENQYWLAVKEKRDKDAAEIKDHYNLRKGILESTVRDGIKEFKGDDEDSVRFNTKLTSLALTLAKEETLEQQTAEHNRRTKDEAGIKQVIDKAQHMGEEEALVKQSLAAQTKEVVAAAEYQKSVYKISADELETIRQNALDREYTQERANLERIAAQYNGMPNLRAKVLVQIDALDANHNAAILTRATHTQERWQALMNGMAKSAEENYAKIEAADTRTAAEGERAAARRTKEMTADLNMMQTEGAKKVAADDKEIESTRRILNIMALMQNEHMTLYQAESAADRGIISSGNAKGEAATALYNKLHQLSIQRQKDINDELIKTGSLADKFKGAMGNMVLEGQEWQNKLVATFEHTYSQMNNTLASFITTGKADWRGLAVGAIQSIIEMALQYVESKVMMMAMDKLFGVQKGSQNVAQATSNVGVAATEALASVPWPFNIAAAAETEAAGAGFISEAAVGFYAGGGIVPNDMPAFVHKNEMVLPAHIAHHVMQTAGSGGGRGNIHYNPIIQGNADEAKLHEHFTKFMKQMIRRGKL